MLRKRCERNAKHIRKRKTQFEPHRIFMAQNLSDEPAHLQSTTSYHVKKSLSTQFPCGESPRSPEVGLIPG